MYKTVSRIYKTVSRIYKTVSRKYKTVSRTYKTVNYIYKTFSQSPTDKLIRAGVDPNSASKGNWTPLHLAAMKGLLFFFFALVTGPKRSLSLKLSDTRVYEPQIRARLGTAAHFCEVVERSPSFPRRALRMLIHHLGGLIKFTMA